MMWEDPDRMGPELEVFLEVAIVDVANNWNMMGI